MYGNIKTYTEYVWKCERIGNVYGNIKKYKEYVWKHKEICPGIHDSECARGSLGSQPVNQQPIAKYSKPLRKTKKNKGFWNYGSLVCNPGLGLAWAPQMLNSLVFLFFLFFSMVLLWFWPVPFDFFGFFGFSQWFGVLSHWLLVDWMPALLRFSPLLVLHKH